MHKHFGLFLVFLLQWLFVAEAQNPSADSLFQLLLNHPGQDTTRARLLIEYSGACYPAFPDSSFKYSDLGYRLSIKLNYKYGIMRGLNVQALQLWNRGEFGQAVAVYRQAVKISMEIRDESFRGKILNNIGILYQSMGAVDSAGIYFERSLESAVKLNDAKMQAKNLSDLGTVHGLKGDYLGSIRSLLQALAIYEKTGSLNDLVITHLRLGNFYSKMKNFRESRREYLVAEKLNGSLKNEKHKLNIIFNVGLLFQQVNGDRDSALIYLRRGAELAYKLKADDVLLSANVNLGNIYYAEKDFQTALEYYTQACNAPRLAGRMYEQTAVLVNLGSVHMNLGNFVEAEKLLREGLTIADRNQFLEFKKIALESLAALAYKQKKYEKAYLLRAEASELSDSLFSKGLKDQIAELQYQYELDKKEAQNRLLVKGNELKEQVIFWQRIIVSAIVIILVLILVILLVLLRSRNRQKALNQQLDVKNQTLTNLNHTKDKFFSIVAHDLKSPFNALMALLTELDESYGEFDEDSRRRIIHLLKISSFNTYNLLVNLLEWSRSQQERIENRAENVALAGVVDEVFATLQTRASLKSHSLVNEVNSGTSVYADPQIIRSLLINIVNNAIKFTPVSGLIRVFARSEGNLVFVCIEDSGIGIPSREIPNLFRIDASFRRSGTEKEPGTGLGLIMCREYAAMIGGELTVTSTEGKGTTMCFTVPALLKEKSE